MPRKKSNKGKKGSAKKKVPQSADKKRKVEAAKMDTSEEKIDKQAENKEEKKTETKEEKILDTRKIGLDELRSNIHLLAQAVSTKDNLLFLRVVRHFNSVRKKMTAGTLSIALKKYSEDLDTYLTDFQSVVKEEDKAETTKQQQIKEQNEKQDKEEAEKLAKEEESRAEAAKAARKGKEPTEEEKKTEEEEKKKRAEEKKKKGEEAARGVEKKAVRERESLAKDAEAKNLPEVKVYMHLLCIVFLIDNKKTKESADCGENLMKMLQSHNRRTLDHLSDKVWHYYSLTQEALGQLSTIRNTLLLAHRTACLQHNEPGQASLIVAILRNFLHYKLYNQADKFRLNTTFPESRSNNNYARYLYYVGQINSVQLHYSDAFANLSQAIRKAPQTTALSFRIKATKLMVIVQLLMGEIPERSIFRQVELKKALQAYFELTQAVRIGDPLQFEQVSISYKSVWVADNLISLIDRLRNNVIKTGLRKINLSYSRISMKDICDKLNFEASEDAENVVAKAINDGVIDAVIDRENGYLFSKENIDIYSTYEPQAAFHKRIQFCNDIHNEAVKALRFPPNAHKSETEKEAEALIDNEKAIDEALAEAEKEDDDM